MKRVRSRASSGGWQLDKPPRSDDPGAGEAQHPAGMIGPLSEPPVPDRSSSLDASRIPAELRSPADPPLGQASSGGASESAKAAPDGKTSTAAGNGEAPGLREQLFATRDAAKGLVSAHVDLAKAEIGDVLDEVKRIAVLAGIAFAVLLLAGLLLPIGLALFIGEALFGSIGWGVLHGSLLLIDVGLVCVLLVVTSARGIGGALLVAVVVGVVVGVVLGLDLTNRAWTAVGDQVAGNIAAENRPLAVAAGSLAVIGAVLGLISGVRGGAMAAILGTIGGAIVGALIGALTAIALGPRVGAAIGVTVALILWPALMGLRAARQGVDGEEFMKRFWPETTIETTKETIEWVRRRMPLGRGS